MPHSLDIPDKRPKWLDKWPDRAAIDAMFSPGIRQMSQRIMHREKFRGITWTDTSLILEIGDQRTTWRLVGDQWRLSCSCGYRQGQCAHAYAAARLFLEICEEHEGQPHKLKKTAATQDTSEPDNTSSHPPKNIRPISTPAPSSPNNTAAQLLEAEVDFHHQPGFATLRFYLREEGRRRILRMQQLLNLALRAKNTRNALNTWPAADRDFLRWLAPLLANRPEVIQNLQVFKISQNKFDNWLKIWESQPNRFIERQSQGTIAVQGAEPRLTIELSDAGTKVEIAAIVTAPSGKRFRFHEIFKLLAAGRRDIVLDGQLTTFHPPLSWNLLNDIFSRKSPHMPKDKVCEFLPHLIENRLDLLAGPLVSNRLQEGKVHVTAEADGADILITAKVDKAPIFPDSTAAAGQIRQKKGKFIVSLYKGADIDAVLSFLRELPLERLKSGKLRLSGKGELIDALVRGWRNLPATVVKNMSPKLKTLLGTPVTPVADLSFRENGRFFETTVDWTCGGVHVPDRYLQDAIRKERQIIRTPSGHWLCLDTEAAVKTRTSVLDLGLGGSTRLFRPEIKKLVERTKDNPLLAISNRSRSLADRLRQEADLPQWTLPAHLNDTLRSYQKEGFDFLASRCTYNVGPILADDMGLGKTLQVIALLAAYFTSPQTDRHGTGALVVCPASVSSVWLTEIAKFCPELRTKAYIGTPDQRQDLLTDNNWDVMISTYALVRNDIEKLANHEFAFVILDEAQQIKNPDAQITRAVKLLKTPRPIALSGTPIENRLLDFWSIMDFLNPDFLGTQNDFIDRYQSPQRHTDLARLIKPVMIRRTKDAVATELPARTEEVILLDLGTEQQDFYNRQLQIARERVQQKGPMEILAALTRLRQVSCHPELVLKNPTTMGSAKLDTLLEMLEELTAEGHSALIFSQFTSMLDIIGKTLTENKIPNLTITGSTPVPKRQQLVQEFQNSDPAQVFLLSLKAAGTGLTLTKADYVFIFDPWWNPAVERQAIDRTHRIGQTKPIIAYRLVAANTVEEKVLKLQQEKADLFDSFMEAADTKTAPKKLTATDMANLLL